MADYWKSNPRRWCDFCKCWLEDNKPSIQFHEKGVKHKKNVEEHIKQARMRGTLKLEEEAMIKKQLEAINRAALEAVGRDAEADPARHAEYVAATNAAKAKPPPPPPLLTQTAAAAAAGVAEQIAVIEAPAPVDETTGLGVWQTVAVSEDVQQEIDLEQQRLEAKRARMEARAERRRKEKTVEFGVKEVESLADDSVEHQPAAFKRRKTDAKRSIRRKESSDEE